MNNIVLEFEKPVVELEMKVKELLKFSSSNQIDVEDEVAVLQKKLAKTKKEVYSNLTPWQRVSLARHPNRPYTLDYIERLFTDFISLHGDRRFAEDPAIVGGFAKLDDRSVMVIGTQKGREIKENVFRNFGCPHPEGYRKALRLMELADKAGVPIITFIDTSGAYPGLASEERHVAEAIAVNLREMFKFTVPIICVVLGEGGSGGALGIGVGNKILVLEHAYYSVITPEGCAAILWKDRAFSPKAAENLRITSGELKELGIIDEIVPEPVGGAHSDYDVAAENLKQALLKNLKELSAMKPHKIKEQRYNKYRKIGRFIEE
jgi:acetyl-CoA carboxylase carboxyl transferase subunit alpha